jgi:hypothetical protein
MKNSWMLLGILLLVACPIVDEDTDGSADTDDSVDTADTGTCEILEDVSCLGENPGEEIACPSGYECSGLSAFWCYRGDCNNLPICLSPDTLIATPTGDRAVSTLREGTIVWTKDSLGIPVGMPVIKVGNTAAPKSHKVLRVELADGRSFRASPNHPVADGTLLATLEPGMQLDGSVVVKAELELLGQTRTWDLLPAGPTGVYKANGVWLGSTLEKPVGRSGLSAMR